MKDLFKANCITCRKSYNSEGCQHDGGECFSCRFAFIQQQFTTIKTSSYEKIRAAKEPQRILPANLTKDLDFKVM